MRAGLGGVAVGRGIPAINKPTGRPVVQLQDLGDAPGMPDMATGMVVLALCIKWSVSPR